MTATAPAVPEPDTVRRAVDAVDRDRLVDLVVALVNIPSPTGEEADIARAYHDLLSEAGMRARLQAIGAVK